MTYPLRERLLDIRNHSETVEEGLRPFPALRAEYDATAELMRLRMRENSERYFDFLDRRNAR